MGIQAFNMQGNTICINAATSPPTPKQAVTSGASGSGNQYEIINPGNVTVFIGAGPNAAAATSNAVVLSSGGTSSSFTYPILAGTDKVMTLPTGWYFTAITASGNTDIYISPGDGM